MNKYTDIAVIGAGSIGLLFSAFLSQSFNVSLYVRRADPAELDTGRHINVAGGGISSAHVQIKSAQEAITEPVIFVALKQTALPAWFEQAGFSENNKTIIFLQNGISHLPLMERLKRDHHVYVGITSHGAMKKDDHTVTLNGFGSTVLALYGGEAADVQPLLEQIHFPFSLEMDWKKPVYEKLLVNALINPLSAVLKVPNGRLIKNDYYRSLLHIAYEEILLLLPEKPVFDRRVGRVEGICLQTEMNRSSMLQDVDHGRMTEIDSILGELMSHSEKGTPVLEFLYNAVKGMDSEIEIEEKEVE